MKDLQSKEPKDRGAMCLTLKPRGQYLHIGPGIVVRITNLRGKKVGLLVVAPKELRIWRSDKEEVP